MLKILIGVVILLVVIVGVYVGLPSGLKAMGVHPDYDIPEFDLSGRRALVITTSYGANPEVDGPRGVFGSEMTIPYYAFLDAGMEVDLASIRGGEIPIQPFSMSWPLATHDDKRFLDDEEAVAKLGNSIAISDIEPGDYDVIFMAGGWGASFDMAQSQELADLITEANAQNIIIGSVCHGALGLVSARAEDGSPLVEGRRVTGVTDKQIDELGITSTPKHPETELRAAGAIFEGESAWRDFVATHTVADGNLVTGQNQNSGYETAHRILELLEARQ